MREAFARWVRPAEGQAVTHVTQAAYQGLQELPSDIGEVTHATQVTQEKHQSEQISAPGPSAPASEIIPESLKNKVTRVTPVTEQKSLDISCNPNSEGWVTGLQNQGTSSCLLRVGVVALEVDHSPACAMCAGLQGGPNRCDWPGCPIFNHVRPRTVH